MVEEGKVEREVEEVKDRSLTKLKGRKWRKKKEGIEERRKKCKKVSKRRKRRSKVMEEEGKN